MAHHRLSECARRRRLGAALRAAKRAWCGRAVRIGLNDCASTIADVQREALGRDLRGAVESIVRDCIAGGFADWRAAATRAGRRLGWRRIDPRRAHVGDVGMLVQGERVMLVQNLARDQWIGPLDHGFAAYRTADGVALAWDVLARRRPRR